MKAFLIPLSIVTAMAPAALAADRTPAMPPKNCVEDQAVKRQMVDQEKAILVMLNDLAPRLMTGPGSLPEIREQCFALFKDRQKCNELGLAPPP